MSPPPDLPAATPKGPTPNPRAAVQPKRAAANPAKKQRPAARPVSLPCDCGKRFQSKEALQRHRQDAKAHASSRAESGDQDRPLTRRCNCGKTFPTASALRAHRGSAKDHALPRPFGDTPAMVLRRRLDEATAVPALAGALRGLGVVAERDAGEAAETCVLCECGRVFGGWVEMYGHLREGGSSAVHQPGGQVTAYSGKVWKRDGEGGEGRGERVGSVEDQNRGASVVAQERAALSCCGRTFKHANALRSHQRDSPKHNQNGPTFNPRLATSKHSLNPLDEAPVRCTCGKTFKHSAALTAHQRDSPKHDNSRSNNKLPQLPLSYDRKDNRSTGCQGGRRGSSSSSSGLDYTYRSYGYDYGYDVFGGGENYGLCDKDCGWCGHCMDYVDI